MERRLPRRERPLPRAETVTDFLSYFELYRLPMVPVPAPEKAPIPGLPRSVKLGVAGRSKMALRMLRVKVASQI